MQLYVRLGAPRDETGQGVAAKLVGAQNMSGRAGPHLDVDDVLPERVRNQVDRDQKVGQDCEHDQHSDHHRADDRDRAKFAKARSYMLRRDDMMVCKNLRCRKRFDISGQSTVITE